MRLPSLQQLNRMNAGDAGSVLDWIDSELTKAKAGVPRSDSNYSRYQKNLSAALRRAKKRREEYNKQWEKTH